MPLTGARDETVFILGCGAIGLSLAAYLADAGRTVLAVRTRATDVDRGTIAVTVSSGATRVSARFKHISLAKLASLHGIIVVAAKSHANAAIVRQLAGKDVSGPVVVMQNGIGVEGPYIEAGLSPVYRCVLLMTSQAASDHELTVRPIDASPIGVVHGDESRLGRVVANLTTPGFPFRRERDIRRHVWKKAIVNVVFNSLCPLLEMDNGIFTRSDKVAGLVRELARELVRECLSVTDGLDIRMSEAELMKQILRISRGSDGILISTLQDIRSGRPTEIGSLNLEIARIAAAMRPALAVPRIELLGKLILAKSSRRD